MENLVSKLCKFSRNTTKKNIILFYLAATLAKELTKDSDPDRNGKHKGTIPIYTLFMSARLAALCMLLLSENPEFAYISAQCTKLAESNSILSAAEHNALNKYLDRMMSLLKDFERGYICIDILIQSSARSNEQSDFLGKVLKDSSWIYAASEYVYKIIYNDIDWAGLVNELTSDTENMSKRARVSNWSDIASILSTVGYVVFKRPAGCTKCLDYGNDGGASDSGLSAECLESHGLRLLRKSHVLFLIEDLGLPFGESSYDIALKEIYLSEEDHEIKQERIKRALNIYYTKPQARNPSQRHIVTTHKVTLIYKSGAKVTCNAKLSKSRSYLILEPHAKDGAYYIFNGQVVAKESISIKKESYERLVHCEKNNAIVKEFLES